MKIVSAKCPSCGANIEVDENSNQTKCEFCHSTIIVEDAIKKYKVEISGTVSLKDAEKIGYEMEKGKIKAQKEENDRIRREREEIIKKQQEEQRILNAKIEKQQTKKELIIIALITPIFVLFLWGFGSIITYFFPEGYTGFFSTDKIALDNEAGGFMLEIRNGYVKIYDWENRSSGYKIKCNTNKETIKFNYKGHSFIVTADESIKAPEVGIIVTIDENNYKLHKIQAGKSLNKRRTDVNITTNIFE